MTVTEKRGRGRPPSPARTERRRQEIIATALRLFAERGYRATTLDDIACALGCTKGLIYHYFRSKTELADQSLRGAHESMRRRLEAIADSTLSPTDKLRRAVEDFVTEILFGYQRHLVILADRAELVAGLDDPRREANRQSVRRFVMLYRRIIAEGMATGEFAAGDASLAANTVIQGLVGIARWYNPRGRLPPERVRDDVCAMLLRMVVAPPAAPGARTLPAGRHEV